MSDTTPKTDTTETIHARTIYQATQSDGSGLAVLEARPGLIVVRTVMDGVAHDAWMAPTDAAALALAILDWDPDAAARALSARQLLQRAPRPGGPEAA